MSLKETEKLLRLVLLRELRLKLYIVASIP